MINNKEAFDEVVSLLMEGKDVGTFESEGYRLSKNTEHVKMIVEGIKAKNRY